MSESHANRVHYYKGQFLRTSDFLDEQEYHNAMRRRHNIGHHQWGIVAGLDLVIDEVDGLPYLQPGMAIDGFGRELIVAQARPLPIERFDLELSDTLDVWIYYLATTGGQNGTGPNQCAPSPSAAGSRWQENPRLWLENPLDEPANRRQPPLVDEALFDFGPHTSPASVDHVWPVFLGKVSRDRSQPAVTYSCDLNHRPFVGAVAANLESPADHTRIQLGGTGDGDPRRFAILLPGDEDPPLELTEETDADSGEVQVGWHLKGLTAFEETLQIERGALQFEAGTACPANALPWTIYQCQGTDGEQQFEALRLEIPDGSAGANRIAIGTWKAVDGQDPAFQSILSIADSGQITVNGNLHVNGAVTVNEAPFSEEAQSQLLSMYFNSIPRVGYLSVLNAGSGLLGQAFPGSDLRAMTMMANVAPAAGGSQQLLLALESLALGPPLDEAAVVHQKFSSPRAGWNNLLEGTRYQTESGNETDVKVICMHDDSTVSFIGETVQYGLHVKTEFELEGIKFVVWHCHLDTRAGVAVAMNETLQRGDVIGTMGSSGSVAEVLVHVILEVPGHGLPGFATPDVINPEPYVLLDEGS